MYHVVLILCSDWLVCITCMSCRRLSLKSDCKTWWPHCLWTCKSAKSNQKSIHRTESSNYFRPKLALKKLVCSKFVIMSKFLHLNAKQFFKFVEDIPAKLLLEAVKSWRPTRNRYSQPAGKLPWESLGLLTDQIKESNGAKNCNTSGNKKLINAQFY
jgi:hypothetical protein